MRKLIFFLLLDSLTVDKFFDAGGETISDVNSDSIWNFHVRILQFFQIH